MTLRFLELSPDSLANRRCFSVWRPDWPSVQSAATGGTLHLGAALALGDGRGFLGRSQRKGTYLGGGTGAFVRAHDVGVAVFSNSTLSAPLSGQLE